MTTQPEIQPVSHERSFLSKLFEGIFILLLLASVAGCDFYAAQVWRHLQAARSWPGATGVMRDFYTHRGGWNRDEIRYVVDLGYRYTVNGSTYVATNQLPDLFLSAFAADQAAQTLRAKGSYLPVFYNPFDPAESVLSQACPSGAVMCFEVLASVTVLAAIWFGRRLVRLATGKEDFVSDEPSFMQGDDNPGLPAGPGARTLRWFFALMGAASCWWLALTIYQDWRVPVAERHLPSAELMLMMEFILAHSGMMVAGFLSAPNQPGQSKTKQMLFLGLIYLVFATSIAAAAQSFRLFLMFSGLLISRWVGLALDSNKARQQQMTRSVEAFVVLLFSVGVCLLLLKLPLEVALIVYFCLIGLFEATLPARKKSWFQPQNVD
jgi:hypothetical protein